jgi:hypothetical protein
MCEVEHNFRFKQMMKYRLNLVFILLFFISIFAISVNAQDAIYCCTSSTNASAHCIEYSSQQEAMNSGCVAGVAEPCAHTDCNHLGCCPSTCSWDYKSNCFGSTFQAFTFCNTITACTSSCCIVEIGGNPMPFEWFGIDTQQNCMYLGGEFHPSPCNEVDITGTSYGSLEGYVKNTNQDPLSDVIVYAGPYKQITNSEGYYYFDQLPATPQGGQTGFLLRAYLTSYTQEDETPPLRGVVIANEENIAQDIIMIYDISSAITIKGRVVDRNGNGISSAVVIIDDSSSTFTDSEGFYTLVTNVLTGSYSLKATKTGYAVSEINLDVESGMIYDGNDFTLSPDTSSYPCGDGIIHPGQDCDPQNPYEGSCPGQCLPDCTCPLSCTDMGYYCADVGYQCTGVNGDIISEFNPTCQTSFNQGFDGGICCNTPPLSLPECIYGETLGSPKVKLTDVEGSGGTYCKCGEHIWDITSSDRYCCLVDGERRLQTNECTTPVNMQGFVTDSNGVSLNGVDLKLSAIYQTTSNNSLTSPNYRFDSVAPGTYTLTASKSGYNDFSSTITLSPGEPSSFNIQLTERRITTPFSLTLSHIKGFSSVKLEVEVSQLDPNLAYYSIIRNDQEIARISSSEISNFFVYIDDTTTWQTTYTYNITGYLDYGEGNLEVFNSDEKTITTGDEACEGILDNKEFCASNRCFSARIPEVCHENDEPPFSYRLLCNNNNRFSYAGGSASNSHCPEGNYCIETNEGVTVCGGQDSCETLGLPRTFGYDSNIGNIFGLFYDREYSSESCMRTAGGGYKFCYYDYFYSNILNRYWGSYTQSDQCLSCDPKGFCYDYQSKNACITDNCGYGLNYNTECKWKNTHPELGKGICYSDDTTTVKYCSACNINNPIFYNTKCTQDICGILGFCVANALETRCDGCTVASTCDLFHGNKNACVGDNEGYHFNGYPQISNPGMMCNSSTSIVYSKDACGIGFCRYTDDDKCIKDSNVDWIYDCEELSGDVGCDQDRFIPSTRMVSQNFITLSRQALSFSTDGTKTYYCISNPGEYCCPDKLMNSGSVVLPNQHYPFYNMEAEKVIWFYSESEYGNPEPIKNRSILIDTKPPQLDVIVSEPRASSLGYELSDIDVTISSHELALHCTDSLTGRVSASQISDETILKNIPKTVTFSGLPDGTYIYQIRCRDIHGNLNNTIYINLEIDRITLIRNPKPNLVTLPYSNINLSLETLDKQYPCFYEMISPRTESKERFPANNVVFNNGRYQYNFYDLELHNSDSYQFIYTCYKDDSLIEEAASTNIMFTIDMIAPTSYAYVQRADQFMEIQPERYYTNPTIKLNCSDVEQGPPREFGCNEIRYCFGPHQCLPSEGTVVQSNNYIFQPQVETSGKYYLCMQSRDAGGNIEEVHCQTIHINLDPPLVSIVTPANNNVIGVSNFQFTGTWNDHLRPERMLAKIVNNDRGFVMDITNIIISGETDVGSFIGSTYLTELYAGLNTLTVTAIDNSGDYGSASINFYYDIYPPDFNKAQIHGEDIVSSSMDFVYGGTGSDDVEIVIDFMIIKENNHTYKHHEYSHRLKPVLIANDYRYIDRNNMFGTDVMGNVTITSVLNDSETFFKELVYNSENNIHEAIFTELFSIGNYSLEYNYRDPWGNSDSYTQIFYVNDTTPPWFKITILDSEGNNITNVRYGSYDVEIIASEPISNLNFLNYTVNGKTKSVQLIDKNGTTLKGLLNIELGDLDMINLRNAKATFSISGVDNNGLTGTTITSIKDFYITTVGPLQPIILSPDIRQSTSNVFYSSSESYDIQGIVFKNSNQGLLNENVYIMRNIISTSMADGNWVELGNTTTTANEFTELWQHGTHGMITYISSDTINLNLNGYEEIFIPGRFIEFESHKKRNMELYEIISIEYVRGTGTSEVLYDVKLEPRFEGFEGFTPESQFRDNIRIYDKSSPDGWFEKGVVLEEGANHFYVYAYDGPNRGGNSPIFTIIYDNMPPNLVNTSPSDGSIIGDINSPVYAYIEPTGSNISSYTMFLNGEEVSTSIFYDELGYAKINYHHSGQLQKGEYTANVIVEDYAGNTLNHHWSFEIDPDAPLTPVIQPSGLIRDTTPLINIRFPQQVVLDEVVLLSTKTEYKFNLTPHLTFSNGLYSYKLTAQNTLIEDEYKIDVKAKRVLGENYGTQGIFSQTFTVDITPPVITQTNSPINNPHLPVYGYVKINEPAICRFGFYDVPYDSLPYTSRVQVFGTEQTLPIYDLNTLRTAIYVKCMDRAGNKMTNPAIIEINVDSLLYPSPAIYIPEYLSEVTKDNISKIIGSTFIDSNPLRWVPDIDVIIGRSSYFYSNDVEFERKLYTKSLSDTDILVVNPGLGFVHDVTGNYIIIDDVNGLFAPGLYVEFPLNRNKDYSLYEVQSVISREDSTALNSVIVTFNERLPNDLDPKQIIYLYDQKAPPGWFDYILNLNQGNNFFYAAGRNRYGEGKRTEVYNIIKDNTNPILYNEFPRNGEIISEEFIEISVIGDGVYSKIKKADFKIGTLLFTPNIEYIKDFESKIKYNTTQPNGLHTINIKAYDGAGLSTEKSWSFTIDASVPQRPDIIPNTYINKTRPSMEIQFSEQVKLESAKIISTTQNYNRDFTNSIQNSGNTRFLYPSQDILTEGEYKIEVRASKADVNQANVGFWYEIFHVDLTPPKIISIPDSVITSKIPVKFLMITDEDAHCRFSESDKSYYDMEHDLSDIFQKNHYVSAYVSSSKTSMYIRCRDIAGNVMPSSKVVTINQKVESSDVCGDGMITGAEECDGNNWGNIRTCNDYNSNFYDGTLSCNPITCRFDVSECNSIHSCRTDADCAPGVPCIDGTCMIYTSRPAVCGNSIVEPGETCDGNDWGRVSGCKDLPGFSSGILRCNQQTCHFDTTNCIPIEPICGNGVVGVGQQCDGDLGGKTCLDFGFSGGQLKCSDCMYDTSDCTGSSGICGDGILNVGEQCDGANVPFTSCSDMNSLFSSGTLSCENCMLSTKNCIKTHVCGDGVVDPGFECDLDIGSATCRLFDNFVGGTLTCSNNCLYNTSKCVPSDLKCGNGLLDAGEQCDYAMDVTVSCSQFGGYQYGEVRCDRNCRYDLSGCSRTPIYISQCGNGQIDTDLGHQCDGNIIPKSCSELGFGVSGYPSCNPAGHEFECHYNVETCGASFICSGNEIRKCNDLSLSYIDGNAICVNGYFDMSNCWSSSNPVINADYIGEVSSNYVNITGKVSKTKMIELYVEGILVNAYSYNNPGENNFKFNNVYLPKSTSSGDGRNDVTLIAYGVFSDINTSFSRNIIVDVTGPAITIIEPETLTTYEEKPLIRINISKKSVCTISYNSGGLNYKQEFDSNDGKIHSVKLSEPLYENKDNPINLECVDGIDNLVTLNTNLNVDKMPALVNDVILATPQTVLAKELSYKRIMLFETLNAKLKVEADSDVRCRYGLGTEDYNQMVDYNSNVNGFMSEWESDINIISNRERVSIYTICKNKAGLLSNTYHLEVIIDPNADIVITNLNSLSPYVNTNQPTIKIGTNRPADCTLKYDLTTKNMFRSLAETYYEYRINVAEFNNLILENNKKYEFRVDCEVSNPDVSPAQKTINVIPDLFPPFIHILSPKNNDVFLSSQSVPIHITTEPLSFVEVFVNDGTPQTKFTDSGKVNFNLILSEGRNTVSVVVTDKAGNQNSTSIDLYFTGEEVAPKINGTYPNNNEFVQSINRLTAFVWTVYGSDLNMTMSDIEVRNEDGIRISGQKEFIPGDPNNQLGNFTYTFQDNLLDGNYTWIVKLTDKFGNVGDQHISSFVVEKGIPVIYLSSPISVDSNSLNQELLHHTLNQTFRLRGRIDSLSQITESFYQINKGAGFGQKEILYLNNGYFDRIITLDNLAEGMTKSYIIKITAKNSEGHIKEFQFDVLHDLEPPIPIGVNIK